MADPAKPIIAFFNEFHQQGILSNTSENPKFPATNVANWRENDVWKREAASAGTQVFDVDLGAVPSAGNAPAILCLDNHNGLTETVSVEVVSDTAGTFPSESVQMASVAIDTDNRKYYRFTASPLERYWRVRFTGCTDAFQIGTLYLGREYQLPRLPLNGYDLHRQAGFGRVNRAVGGAGVGAVTQLRDRIQRPRFANFTEAQATTFGQFWESHGRLIKPFFWLPDITNYASVVYFMWLTGDPELSMPTRDIRRSLTINMIGPARHDFI